MIVRMKRRLIAVSCWLFTLLTPVFAFADDSIKFDARMDCYAKPVGLDSNGTGGTWVLFVVLCLITLGVLFKSSNRSHLD